MNEYKGICRVCLLPMREGGSNDSPMKSQLLFGEHYSVIESQDGWINIELDFDGSQGWIRADQHTNISVEYFEQINNSDYKVCTDLAGSIFFQKKYVNILLGSILPISTNELFKLEEQVAYNGSSKSLSQKREFEFFKEIVSRYLYTPYLPGGKSPFGIDESGFIQQVFKICGYRLKRTLNQQILQGDLIKSMNQVDEGDVVFTSTGSEISGAFIAMESDNFIGIYNGIVQNIKSDYVKSNFIEARRYILNK